MLEIAYVLPIMLGVILFVVETVAFALNSFAANDVLTDVHSAIISEVSDVSNLDSGSSLSPAPVYASCDGGKVVLPTGANAVLKTHVQQALEEKGVTFNSEERIEATITPSIISGFDVYVLNFTATANSLLLPEMLEVMLPISVDTIISIKDNCTS